MLQDGSPDFPTAMGVEIRAVVSAEATAPSSLGEAWQACMDIWTFEEVFPRESVISAGLQRTDTYIARRGGRVVA